MVLLLLLLPLVSCKPWWWGSPATVTTPATTQCSYQVLEDTKFNRLGVFLGDVGEGWGMKECQVGWAEILHHLS